MNNFGIILTLECSVFAVFILIVGGLIMFKWKNLMLRYNAGSKDNSSERKFMILPQTGVKCAQLQRNIEQFQTTSPPDLDNDWTADECSMIDETIYNAGGGRLYFSLKYDPERYLLTIKLIKGENLPTISPDGSKAYVNVEVINNKADKKAAMVVKHSRNTIYQRTYTFVVEPSELVVHAVHFEISRYDRFSRKYDIGYVHIALSELRAQGIDLNREMFFTKDYTCTNNKKPELSRKRKLSSHTARIDETQILHQVQKVPQRNPQVLWSKLSHAVHAGLFEELRRTRHESLQWDPFLVVQRYEYSTSDTYRHKEDDGSPSCSNDSHNVDQKESLDGQEWISNVFCPSTECQVDNSSTQEGNESHECTSHLIEKSTSLNQEFYRLVHSPSIVGRRESSIDPMTSWSIPETFQFHPSPVRTQAHTVIFQSASDAKHLRQDRLHKLTSLSSNYRAKILRKSRKRGATGRGRLAGKITFHESLYLDKETQHMKLWADKRAFKRMRKLCCDERRGSKEDNPTRD